MLDSAYIELLGWEKGKPIQRAEIADQAIGFDALVFRTANAQESYLQLKAAGFAVNPVQDLSREAHYQGETVLVRFKTVRFAEQPIEGIRIYLCEHLTPEYVWQAQWLEHKNQLSHLAKITVSTADIRSTVDTFQRLLNLDPKAISQHLESAQIKLSNLVLDIQRDPLVQGAHILKAELNQNLIDPVDFVIDNSFFNQL